jgi:copper homeostasis protein (lipoprotein)
MQKTQSWRDGMYHRNSVIRMTLLPICLFAVVTLLSPIAVAQRSEMTGMFQYMADAATFTGCASGQRWPVAMEADYKALEKAYLKMRREPGEQLLVTIAGRVAMKPNADGGRPTRTLVVERYIGIWPGETCGPSFPASPLQETYWKLTRVDGKPVILADKQREPSLVFRSEQNRVTGFSGCNNLTGGYKLNGPEVTFTGVAATRMACQHGMEIEAAVFAALDKARRFRIIGQHLELYDASGNMLARFEARPVK